VDYSGLPATIIDQGRTKGGGLKDNNMEGNHEKILESAIVSEATCDSDIIDFDGPGDPMIARNWKPSKKWYLITTLSAMTFVT
jgi:hypothetical protein